MATKLTLAEITEIRRLYYETTDDEAPPQYGAGEASAWSHGFSAAIEKVVELLGEELHP